MLCRKGYFLSLSSVDKNLEFDLISMCNLQVAELLWKRTFIESLTLVRVVLLLLSTRLGTLLLCGSLCLADKWPYINYFSCMPLEQREKVLQSWFKHCLFTPIRIAFIYLKVVCLYTFFSRVINSMLPPLPLY